MSPPLKPPDNPRILDAGERARLLIAEVDAVLQRQRQQNVELEATLRRLQAVNQNTRRLLDRLNRTRSSSSESSNDNEVITIDDDAEDPSLDGSTEEPRPSINSDQSFMGDDNSPSTTDQASQIAANTMCMPTLEANEQYSNSEDNLQQHETNNSRPEDVATEASQTADNEDNAVSSGRDAQNPFEALELEDNDDANPMSGSTTINPPLSISNNPITSSSSTQQSRSPTFMEIDQDPLLLNTNPNSPANENPAPEAGTVSHSVSTEEPILIDLTLDSEDEEFVEGDLQIDESVEMPVKPEVENINGNIVMQNVGESGGVSSEKDLEERISNDALTEYRDEAALSEDSGNRAQEISDEEEQRLLEKDMQEANLSSANSESSNLATQSTSAVLNFRQLEHFEEREIIIRIGREEDIKASFNAPQVANVSSQIESSSFGLDPANEGIEKSGQNTETKPSTPLNSEANPPVSTANLESNMLDPQNQSSSNASSLGSSTKPESKCGDCQAPLNKGRFCSKCKYKRQKEYEKRVDRAIEENCEESARTKRYSAARERNLSENPDSRRHSGSATSQQSRECQAKSATSGESFDRSYFVESEDGVLTLVSDDEFEISGEQTESNNIPMEVTHDEVTVNSERSLEPDEQTIQQNAPADAEHTESQPATSPTTSNPSETPPTLQQTNSPVSSNQSETPPTLRAESPQSDLDLPSTPPPLAPIPYPTSSISSNLSQPLPNDSSLPPARPIPQNLFVPTNNSPLLPNSRRGPLQNITDRFGNKTSHSNQSAANFVNRYQRDRLAHILNRLESAAQANRAEINSRREQALTSRRADTFNSRNSGPFNSRNLPTPPGFRNQDVSEEQPPQRYQDLINRIQQSAQIRNLNSASDQLHERIRWLREFRARRTPTNETRLGTISETSASAQTSGRPQNPTDQSNTRKEAESAQSNEHRQNSREQDPKPTNSGTVEIQIGRPLNPSEWQPNTTVNSRRQVPTKAGTSAQNFFNSTSQQNISKNPSTSNSSINKTRTNSEFPVIHRIATPAFTPPSSIGSDSPLRMNDFDDIINWLGTSDITRSNGPLLNRQTVDNSSGSLNVSETANNTTSTSTNVNGSTNQTGPSNNLPKRPGSPSMSSDNLSKRSRNSSDQIDNFTRPTNASSSPPILPGPSYNILSDLDSCAGQFNAPTFDPYAFPDSQPVNVDSSQDSNIQASDLEPEECIGGRKASASRRRKRPTVTRKLYESKRIKSFFKLTKVRKRMAPKRKLNLMDPTPPPSSSAPNETMPEMMERIGNIIEAAVDEEDSPSIPTDPAPIECVECHRPEKIVAEGRCKKCKRNYQARQRRAMQRGLSTENMPQNSKCPKCKRMGPLRENLCRLCYQREQNIKKAARRAQQEQPPRKVETPKKKNCTNCQVEITEENLVRHSTDICLQCHIRRIKKEVLDYELCTGCQKHKSLYRDQQCYRCYEGSSQQSSSQDEPTTSNGVNEIEILEIPPAPKSVVDNQQSEEIEVITLSDDE